MTTPPWLEQLRGGAVPRVIAHRGDSFRAPENTIEAARLGFQSGAFAWELDVHLSNDGVPVVIHDESLLRTTNVADRFAGDPRGERGFPVSQFSVEQLKTLDAGSWFLSSSGGSRSAGGFNSLGRVPKEIVERCHHGQIRIPTLREALEVTKQWKWWVNVEIKSFPNFSERIVSAVLDEIAALEMAERVLISSFNHDDVVEARRLAPGIATGLLVCQPLHRPDMCLKQAGVDCYHSSAEVLGSHSDRYHDQATSDRLRWEQLRGLVQRRAPILVYTVNDARPGGLADNLAELGVSAIFSDDPERLVTHFCKQRDES